MDTESLLKGIGVSAAIISGALLVGIGFLAYKNFYELQKTKLEILKLQKELDLPMDNQLIKGYANNIKNKIIKPKD